MDLRKTLSLFKKKKKIYDASAMTDRTQPHNTSKGKKSLSIGLDFGTAFTKVVIGEARIKYAVPFGEYANPENPYLLPSILKIDNQNICHLTNGSSKDNNFDDLKISLIENNYTDSDLVKISAYLALVFRSARYWLLTEHDATYNGSQLDWMINTGLPSILFDDSQISEIYKKLVQSAWTVSVLPGPVTLSRVEKYLSFDLSELNPLPDEYKSRIISPELVSSFPEFSAQIYGYVNSRKRKDGLHMLVDIGGGTLDIVTFDITGKFTGENNYYIYQFFVGPLGVKYFLKNRLKNLNLPAVDTHLSENVPNNKEYAQLLGCSEKDIVAADSDYRKRIVSLLNTTLDITKKDYNVTSPHWAKGVPTFLCGGGSNIRLFKGIFSDYEKRLPPKKITLINFSKPDHLSMHKEHDDSFDRLSVAYGLSFDPFDIGESIKEAISVRENLGKVICPHCDGIGCSRCNSGMVPSE